MAIVFAILAVMVLAAFIILAGATTYRYGRHDLLHPVVLVNGIMAYFVLIPATYFLATGMQTVPAKYGLIHPTRALAVALVVLFGMYIVILAAYRWGPWGQPSPRNTRSRFDVSAVGDAFADTNPGVLLVIGLVGFSIGLLVYGYYVFANGGLVRLLTVTPRTAFQITPNTYRFRLLGLMGVVGGWVTVLCALRPALERRQSVFASLRQSPRAIALAAVVTSITMFVAVSTRARMVILVPALIALVYGHTAGWLSQRTLVGVGAVIVTIGVSFSAIESILNGYTIAGIIHVFVRGVVQVPRLALFMVLIERVPSEVSFMFGATIPEAFYIDLPGDPRYGNVVERIATGTDKDTHFASAMLPGELWVNFGPVGILVGGVVYGAALRWAYRLREATVPLVRGVQPALFVCILLLWPTNLTWGLPNLFVRILVPVLVAVIAALIIQRRFPSIARTIYNRTGISE